MRDHADFLETMHAHVFFKTETLVWRLFIIKLPQMFYIWHVKPWLQRLVLAKSSKHMVVGVFPVCLYIIQTQFKSPAPEFSSMQQKIIVLNNYFSQWSHFVDNAQRGGRPAKITLICYLNQYLQENLSLVHHLKTCLFKDVWQNFDIWCHPGREMGTETLAPS